eukprot:4865955-Lingulodinium_polyedra.AAC.1
MSAVGRNSSRRGYCSQSQGETLPTRWIAGQFGCCRCYTGCGAPGVPRTRRPGWPGGAAATPT